jgi:predicted aconitase
MEAFGISRMGETVKTAAQDMACSLTGTVSEVRTKDQESAMTAASAVTDTVKGAGAYLQEKRVGQITGDLTALVSRYSITSVLIGLGLGFLLARSLGSDPPTQGS